MHLSAVEACQEDAIFLFLHFHIEETGQNLDGIGALLVDIVTRVASVQSLDIQFEEEISGRSLLAREVEGGMDCLSTGTRNEDKSFVL